MSFKDIFNIDAEVKQSAHARVNLIGEHTDYTGGYVMPTLLSFKNTIEISQNNSNEFTVFSQHFKDYDIKLQDQAWISSHLKIRKTPG